MYIVMYMYIVQEIDDIAAGIRKSELTFDDFKA